VFPPQQPQYGGYGQQPPGGYPGYPQPPKKKSPLPWILGGAGLVVVLIIVLVVVLSRGGGSSSDPKAVAQAYVNAVNSKSTSAMKDLVCPTDLAKANQLATSAPKLPSGVTVDMKATLGTVTVNGNKATANVTLDLTINGKTSSTNAPMPLQKNSDGEWQICGLTDALNGGSGNGG
jgi:hypothetical protein